jgi:hypothetical protein
MGSKDPASLRGFVAVSKAPPANHPSDEVTYKGYRIQPRSYSVNSSTWSPRAEVSLRTDGGWARGTPLYSSNATRFPSRDDADRQALEVARAWIDAAIGRQRQ